MYYVYILYVKVFTMDAKVHKGKTHRATSFVNRS
jgi:hypothetical protein